MQQYRLLNIIGRTPRTLGDIARIIGVTPATATTIVRTLEDNGWVRREVDALDKRRFIISLTAEGTSVSRRANERAEQYLADAFMDLTDGEVEHLMGSMESLDRLMPLFAPGKVEAEAHRASGLASRESAGATVEHL
jgi:MarR family transcriptional regulator, organic hydroperoxide resistance regulator